MAMFFAVIPSPRVLTLVTEHPAFRVVPSTCKFTTTALLRGLLTFIASVRSAARCAAVLDPDRLVTIFT